jgi:hypothetical protein
MLKSGLSCLALLAALVAACTGQPAATEKLCTPGANVFCRCVDRREGIKHCRSDGQSFEPCMPCDGSDFKGEGSGGTDGLGSGHGTDATEGDDSWRGDEDSEPPEEATVDGGDGTIASVDAGRSSSTIAKKDGGAPPSPITGYPDTQHCKPLENRAPMIELQKVADVPKPALGGKPMDGLYVQSWVIEFTGEDGATGPSKHYSSETLELTGSVGRYVFEDDGGTKAAGGFRLTRNGTNVDVGYECPASAPKALAYDATDSTLILYDPPYARVFVRQKGVTK